MLPANAESGGLHTASQPLGQARLARIADACRRLSPLPSLPSRDAIFACAHHFSQIFSHEHHTVVMRALRTAHGARLSVILIHYADAPLQR